MMEFSGWEKLSLVDFDDNVTTTLFVAGCNFRCPFCHNSSLVLNPKEAPTIPWSEIMAYLKKRQGILDAVCVSGGEPTLMDDLKDKLRDIKTFGYKVKLDTNGTNPNVVKELYEEGLIDYVAMDIKNCLEGYPAVVGLAKVNESAIKETIDFLMHSGIQYEFRTTLIKEAHDEETIKKIGILLEGADKLFLQMFVNGDNCIRPNSLHKVEIEEAKHFREILQRHIKSVNLRGY